MSSAGWLQVRQQLASQLQQRLIAASGPHQAQPHRAAFHAQHRQADLRTVLWSATRPAAKSFKRTPAHLWEACQASNAGECEQSLSVQA